MNPLTDIFSLENGKTVTHSLDICIASASFSKGNSQCWCHSKIEYASCFGGCCVILCSNG